MEKLDWLSARTRAAKDHLAKVQSLATRAKQATLAAIFAELSTETKRSIGSLTERITKGSSPKWQGFAYQDEGILFVRSQNVGWGLLLLEDKAYLPPEFNAKQKSSVICPDDVLLNIVGASIGRSAIADERISGANCNQAVAVIRLNDANSVSSQFLNLWLGSDAAQSQILEGSVDVARANFSLAAIKNLTLPWPRLKQQTEIVSRIEAAFSRIDKMVAEASRAAELLERLKQQLLAKAFRGELVAQDPNDEPASVLLDRIREARAADKKAKPKRRTKPAKKEPNDAFKRSVLAAYIADTLCDHPTFGRVKFQKLLHLSEGHTNANEVSGDYQRDAAGPFDTRMMRSVQSQITKQGWIVTSKRDGDTGTFYGRGEKVGAYKTYFDRYFGDRKDDIDYLLALFKTAKTQQAEIVSTIFAAWNDLLLEGETPTDDMIVELIFNDWHDSKRKIAREQWLKALH